MHHYLLVHHTLHLSGVCQKFFTEPLCIPRSPLKDPSSLSALFCRVKHGMRLKQQDTPTEFGYPDGRGIMPEKDSRKLASQHKSPQNDGKSTHASAWVLAIVRGQNVNLLARIFSVPCLEKTNRAPFDSPEAEAALVAGHNVEYFFLLCCF